MSYSIIENGVGRAATPEEAAEFDALRAAASAAEVLAIKAESNGLVLAQLKDLDTKSVRPLRAVLAAQAGGQAPDPADVAKLIDLKAQADALRAQMVV